MFSALSSLGGMVKSPPPYIPIFPFTTSLTGSDITYANNTFVLTFKSNGTLTFKNNVTLPTLVNYLVVGGGGTGSIFYNKSGGGGAGGEVKQFTGGSNGTTLSAANLIQTQTIVVGASFYNTDTSSQSSGRKGNPSSVSIPGVIDISANGGEGAKNTYNWNTYTVDPLGGVGQNGGGSGGPGGGSTSASNGANGTAVTIRGITYYFAGGGAGGAKNFDFNPIGGLGGGGGRRSNGNVLPYYGPNGIIERYNSISGFNNSGGGGAGAEYQQNPGGGSAGSGIVVVWFTYT